MHTIDLLCQAIIQSPQPSIEALRFAEAALQKLINVLSLIQKLIGAGGSNAMQGLYEQHQEITEKTAFYAESSLFSDKIFWSADKTWHTHDKFSIEFDCRSLTMKWISCVAQAEPNIALTRFDYLMKNGWLSDYPERLKAAQSARSKTDSSSEAARSKD